MIPLVAALAAALLVLVAAQGIRMLATTGLESAISDDPFAQRRSRGFYALVDSLGERFVRTTRRLYGPGRLDALDARIRAAGRPEGMTQASYLQRHTGFVILGLVILLLMALNGRTIFGLVAAILFAVWMPLWVRLSARDRRARIEKELPDFLDVLAVTVNAGVAFRPALARVSQQHEGPLREEVTVTLDEMELGVSRRAAFTALRNRAGTEGVATFVTALLQAEELGVPLADALNDIAAEIRREHAQRVKRAAAKAASKVSLVTTLTIVPGALILIVSVMLIRNVDSLAQLFGEG